MQKNRTWTAGLVVTAFIVGWLAFTGQFGQLLPDGSEPLRVLGANRPAAEARATTLQDFMSSYIVDPNNRIAFKDTDLNDQRTDPDTLPKNTGTSALVNRDTAQYFRFLQTHFNTGASLQANTDAIHQHLLSTLPKEDAEQLFALYTKFLDFELSLGDRTKGWQMPENPVQALELIKKMQQLQQQQFGPENADLLFGGEMKTMEYTARKAAIYNDRVASGAEKEALMRRLNTDMFGAEGQQIDEKKNPYNLFEEKMLLYKNDLDKLDPLGQEQLIKGLRAKFLPASANSP